MSKKENKAPVLYTIIGGLIVTYYIFIFDYKRLEFNWIHSLLGIIAVGMLIINVPKISEKEDN